jgi:predicted RNA-binding Zn-ribbon protein involved in translation (DUF1610 family)
LPLPEPILRYQVPFADVLGNAEPGCEPWRVYGQHQLWIGRYPASAPPLHVQELRPEGLVEYETREFLVHRVAAGMPYRVTTLMGFWHVSDADMLWFQIPRSALTYYLALAGGRTNIEGNHSVVWYCGECAHEIYRDDFARVGDTGRLLSQIATAVVEAFNADPARRRCPACGWEHPPAYPFTPLDPTSAAAAGPNDW